MEHPAAGGSVYHLPPVSDVDLRAVGVERSLYPVSVNRSALGTHHWNVRHDCLARCCALLFVPAENLFTSTCFFTFAISFLIINGYT